MTSQGDQCDSMFDGRSLDAEALMPRVYDELKLIARRLMAQERADHTLQTTALVNELYLRLFADRDLELRTKAQFYAAAGEAMRRILIDHARKKNAQKRGGDVRRVSIEMGDLADSQDPEQILAVDEAFSRLEQEDERSAAVVRLRFFAGLNVDQTAEVLGISPRTVAREWSYARARLLEMIRAEHDGHDELP